MNFCLPIAPSIGSIALRRYALNAQPKSEMSTPVKRRSMPLITREGSVRPQESRRAFARPARDVGAGLDRRDEPREVLGRVLEVAVHRHEDLAARPDEPRVHRRVLAEVPLEADGADPPVGGVQALELRERRRRSSRRRRRSARTRGPPRRASRPSARRARAGCGPRCRPGSRPRSTATGVVGRRERAVERLLAGAGHGRNLTGSRINSLHVGPCRYGRGAHARP